MVQDIKAVGPIGPKLRGPLVKLGSNEFKENDQDSSFTQRKRPHSDRSGMMWKKCTWA